MPRASRHVVAAVPADAGAGPDEFLASDLIGDDAYFADGELHGHVNDLIVIDDDIAAVVIDSEGGGLLCEYGPFSQVAVLDLHLVSCLPGGYLLRMVGRQTVRVAV